MTTEFYSFVYTIGTDERYYYQALDSDGRPSGSLLIYSNLVDFQGTEEEFIPAKEFDERFIVGKPPWKKNSRVGLLVTIAARLGLL